MSNWKAVAIGAGAVLALGAVQQTGPGRYTGFPMADGDTWVVVDAATGDSCRFTERPSDARLDEMAALIQRAARTPADSLRALVTAEDMLSEDCRRFGPIGR